MKETPILFSGAMIRALPPRWIKSQTRRIIKPQPEFAQVYDWKGKRLLDVSSRQWCWKQHVFGRYPDEWIPQITALCPYGVVGDLLWVRETWASPEVDKKRPGRVAYDADGLCGCWIGGGEDRVFLAHGRILEASGYSECFPAGGSSTYGLGKYTDVRSGEFPAYRYGWRPSIFMPRWASRFTFRLTDVVPQRIQDITEEDAIAEGIPSVAAQFALGIGGPGYWDTVSYHSNGSGGKTYHVARGDGHCVCHQGERGAARCAYRLLYDSINGPGAWQRNDWVWRLSFEAVS